MTYRDVSYYVLYNSSHHCDKLTLPTGIEVIFMIYLHHQWGEWPIQPTCANKTAGSVTILSVTILPKKKKNCPKTILRSNNIPEAVSSKTSATSTPWPSATKPRRTPWPQRIPSRTRRYLWVK